MTDVPMNAIAGPSSPRKMLSITSFSIQSPPAPTIFFPPPGPPLAVTHLASTQDLISRFNLLPAYDKYVRPFAAPTDGGLDPVSIATSNTPNTTAVDKGKAREISGNGGTLGGGPGGDGDDDDAAGGKKKKKNNYRHLIKGIPGKHSMRKDDYLTSMMLMPPKQRTQITPFDSRTQREAFTVSLEGLKGWNPSNLIAESPQAREHRKKQKEAKRFERMQQQLYYQALPQGASPVVAAVPQSSIQAPIPISVSAPSTISRPAAPTPRPNATSTPRPTATSTPVGSSTTRPGSSVPRPGSAVPRPGTAVPRPITAASNLVRPPGLPQKPVASLQQPPNHLSTSASAPVMSLAGQPSTPRGIKRDRDDHAGMHTGNLVNGAPVGNGYVKGPAVPMPGADIKPIINARAGNAGIRPRPVKKQRMDMQGQARDVTSAPVQQPTPQGV